MGIAGKLMKVEKDIVNHSNVMLYDTLKLSTLSKQSETNCCKTIAKKKRVHFLHSGAFISGIHIMLHSFHTEKNKIETIFSKSFT